jgi:hypothetical protein
MKTYQIRRKTGIFVLGVVFSLAGLFFGGLMLVGLVREIISGNANAYVGGRGAELLIGAGIGGGAAYLGWLYMWRRVYEVRIPGDGSVELFGVLRHPKMTGSDVIELRRSIAKVINEDADPRELRVRSRRGTLLVPYFEDIEALVADIRALDTRIAVTGEWPRANK